MAAAGVCLFVVGPKPTVRDAHILLNEDISEAYTY